MAVRLARRGYLLETGRSAAENETKITMANDTVRKAYLGIWVSGEGRNDEIRFLHHVGYR
jgi:ABC-type lipopolysaccharide export system ATPase subunit